MKNNLKLLIPILVLLFLSISSCKKDLLDENNTFGIRHDVNLEQYESIATNLAPYNTADYPDFSPVVSFKYSLDGSENQEYTASGTIVNEKWILTAGHNFFVADEQSEPALASGIRVYVGLDPDNADASYEVESLHFHPTWIQDNKDFVYANDLCLVKLKTAISSVKPAIMNLTKEEQLDSKVWFAGFGDYSKIKGQDKNASSKKHALENILDRANDGITTTINGITYSGGLLAFDFDSPNQNFNALADSEINEDEAILGAGTSSAASLDFEGTTVAGDSGGPLFVKVGNEWKLAGVLSGGVPKPFAKHKDSSYGDISVFIRVATHSDWIESLVQ